MKGGLDQFDVITVGERGQVVIPAALRKQFGVKPGDKLFAVGHHKGISLLPMKQIPEMMEMLQKKLAKLEKVRKAK